MIKVGLFTYHSAYNFGSALQAFATQEAIKNCGYDCTIINYRMPSQKDFYSLYKHGYGKKELLKDFLKTPINKQRRERAEAFEKFFSQYLTLTPEVSSPSDAEKQESLFPVMVSGSDQIWNKHSCEMAFSDWSFMDPYVLKRFKGSKISYASSIGAMTDEEIKVIAPYIERFDFISMREQSSADKLSRFISKPVDVVIDPTLLLNGDQWIKSIGICREEKSDNYILFYMLKSYKDFHRYLPQLEAVSKKYDCDIKVITPYIYARTGNKRIVPYPEWGPVEFLNAIYNASAVLTDSYHGTILSLNLHKNVYSVCEPDGAEFRKTEILSRLGLDDRIVSHVEDTSSLDFEKGIDFPAMEEKLVPLRNHSLNYLKNALDTCAKKVENA